MLVFNKHWLSNGSEHFLQHTNLRDSQNPLTFHWKKIMINAIIWAHDGKERNMHINTHNWKEQNATIEFLCTYNLAEIYNYVKIPFNVLYAFSIAHLHRRLGTRGSIALALEYHLDNCFQNHGRSIAPKSVYWSMGTVWELIQGNTRGRWERTGQYSCSLTLSAV